MEKKIYEAPHVRVIELEFGSYLLAGSPNGTFNIGTKPDDPGEKENGGIFENNPEDID